MTSFPRVEWPAAMDSATALRLTPRYLRGNLCKSDEEETQGSFSSADEPNRMNANSLFVAFLGHILPDEWVYEWDQMGRRSFLSCLVLVLRNSPCCCHCGVQQSSQKNLFALSEGRVLCRLIGISSAAPCVSWWFDSVSLPRVSSRLQKNQPEKTRRETQ